MSDRQIDRKKWQNILQADSTIDKMKKKKIAGEIKGVFCERMKTKYQRNGIKLINQWDGHAAGLFLKNHFNCVRHLINIFYFNTKNDYSKMCDDLTLN